LFVPTLWRARFEQARSYGALALDYVRDFHKRWVAGRERPSPLGTPDIQSLADLATSCDVMVRSRPVPFGFGPILVLSAAVLVPMIPLALIRIPFLELVKKVAASAAGRRP
jgi:hypothetical protein